MSTLAGRSMTQRMIGAATLDVPTFEEVEHDTTATGQAAGVVALAAVARGIGSVGHGSATVIGALVAAFVGWLVWSGITYLIGTRLFEGKATWGEVLRTLGFAQAPGILLVVAFVPILGAVLGLIVALWLLVAGFVALRQALDLSNGKTVLTVVVGWLAVAIPMWLLHLGTGG